jgi:uncharacterized membrane protein
MNVVAFAIFLILKERYVAVNNILFFKLFAQNSLWNIAKIEVCLEVDNVVTSTSWLYKLYVVHSMWLI